MKNLIIYFAMALLFMTSVNLSAQTINPANLQPEKPHVVNAVVNVEHGAGFGIGYGYMTKVWKIPVIAGIDFSIPGGENLADDFKARIGCNILWVDYHNFRFSTKIYGVFRRYDNEFVRILNFGSDMTGTIGYYRPRWFLAADFRFDKAIVDHFKHKDFYREQYSGVVDGWYEPAAGGNFFYGLTAGSSIGNFDIFISGGKVIGQDFKVKPTLPFYAQFGVAGRF